MVKINLLKQLVNIPSYTGDKQAINKVNKILVQEFHKLGLKVTIYKSANAGDLLVIKSPVKKSLPKLLLSGHSDIVVLPEFNKFVARGDRYYGSGVADMKGGLVVMLGVLQALLRADKLFNITCIINPDEEKGSVAYKKELARIYKQHDYAFIFEPALEVESGRWRSERWLVTKRRGVAWVDLGLKGDGGHAGNDKIINSPVIEMSKKILKWSALNNPRRGVSVNVGKVWGGKEANIIPPDCFCRLDIRSSKSRVHNDILKSVKKILNQGNPGFKSFYKPVIDIVPLEENKKTKFLKKKAELVWRQNNLKFINILRGGGSDANQIAVHNVGVLDGLGPVGGGAHTNNEWVYKDSFEQSVKLTFAIINMIL